MHRLSQKRNILMSSSPLLFVNHLRRHLEIVSLVLTLWMTLVTNKNPCYYADAYDIFHDYKTNNNNNNNNNDDNDNDNNKNVLWIFNNNNHNNNASDSTTINDNWMENPFLSHDFYATSFVQQITISNEDDEEGGIIQGITKSTSKVHPYSLQQGLIGLYHFDTFTADNSTTNDNGGLRGTSPCSLSMELECTNPAYITGTGGDDNDAPILSQEESPVQQYQQQSLSPSSSLHVGNDLTNYAQIQFPISNFPLSTTLSDGASSSSSSSSSSMTTSIWIKPSDTLFFTESLVVTTPLMDIVMKTGNPIQEDNYCFQCKLRQTIDSSTSSGIVAQTCTTANGSNDWLLWRHIICSYDATNQQVRIYLNGNLGKTTQVIFDNNTTSTNTTTTTTGSNDDSSSSSFVMVGLGNIPGIPLNDWLINGLNASINDAPSTTISSFQGYLDEIGLWNRTLSNSEISYLSKYPILDESNFRDDETNKTSQLATHNIQVSQEFEALQVTYQGQNLVTTTTTTTPNGSNNNTDNLVVEISTNGGTSWCPIGNGEIFTDALHGGANNANLHKCYFGSVTIQLRVIWKSTTITNNNDGSNDNEAILTSLKIELFEKSPFLLVENDASPSPYSYIPLGMNLVYPRHTTAWIFADVMKSSKSKPLLLVPQQEVADGEGNPTTSSVFYDENGWPLKIGTSIENGPSTGNTNSGDGNGTDTNMTSVSGNDTSTNTTSTNSDNAARRHLIQNTWMDETMELILNQTSDESTMHHYYLLMNGLKGYYPTGRYTLITHGSGTLLVAGDCGAPRLLTSPGRHTLNIQNTTDQGFLVLIQQSLLGDHIHNIQIFMPGIALPPEQEDETNMENSTNSTAATDNNEESPPSAPRFQETFHPQFLKTLKGTHEVMRFADWSLTRNGENQIASWTQRNTPSSASQTLEYAVHKLVSTIVNAEDTTSAFLGSHLLRVTTTEPHGLHTGQIVDLANSNSSASVTNMIEVQDESSFLISYKLPNWIDGTVEQFSINDLLNVNTDNRVIINIRPGVALEHQIELCNRIGSDGYFNVPHLADEAYIYKMASLIFTTLEPSAKAYIEYSHEVWNLKSPQGLYAYNMATSQNITSLDRHLIWYGRQASNVFDIFQQVFGGNGVSQDRLVRIVASQAGYGNVELAQVGTGNVDALAIAVYFGANLNSKLSSMSNWQDLSVNQIMDMARDDILEDTLASISMSAQQANDYNVKLVAYEGGQHLGGRDGNNSEYAEEIQSKFQAANHHPRMQNLYRSLLMAWSLGAGDAGGGVFVPYNHMAFDSDLGSWAALQHHFEELETAWKYSALMENLAPAPAPQFSFDIENYEFEVAFNDATLHEEVKIFYKISDNPYVFSLYEMDCTTPASDNVLNFTIEKTPSIPFNTHSDLAVKVDVKQDMLGNATNIWSYDDATYTGHLTFCAKIEVGIEGIDKELALSVNFHELQVNVYVDMRQEFALDDVLLDRDNVTDFYENDTQLEYNILAYQCDSTGITTRKALSQGSVLHLCVDINSTQSVLFGNIGYLRLKQAGSGGGELIPIKDSQVNSLTNMECFHKNYKQCIIRTLMTSKFFTRRNRNNVTVSGIAFLEFGGTRHLATETDTKKLRRLEDANSKDTVDDVNELEFDINFDFNVLIELEEDQLEEETTNEPLSEITPKVLFAYQCDSSGEENAEVMTRRGSPLYLCVETNNTNVAIIGIRSLMLDQEGTNSVFTRPITFGVPDQFTDFDCSYQNNRLCIIETALVTNFFMQVTPRDVLGSGTATLKYNDNNTENTIIERKNDEEFQVVVQLRRDSSSTFSAGSDKNGSHWRILTVCTFIFGGIIYCCFFCFALLLKRRRDEDEDEESLCLSRNDQLVAV